MTPPNKHDLAQLIRIEDVIDRDGYQLEKTGHSWMRSKVHDSLVVNTDKQSFWWYGAKDRGAQKWCGDLYNWLQATRNVSYTEAKRIVDEDLLGKLPRPAVIQYEREPKPEPRPLRPTLHHYFRKLLDSDREAYEWWLEQGITGEAIDHFVLGVVEHRYYGKCYTIPVIEAGKLINIRLRLAHPTGPKGDKYRPLRAGYGSQLFNADILTPQTRGVVVTAGEKKAIVLSQYDIPAVSSTAGCGHWRSEWNDRFRHCQKVFFAYDPAETAHAYEHAARLGSRAYVVQMPANPDDFILANGEAAFRCLLSQAVADRRSSRLDKIAA